MMLIRAAPPPPEPEPEPEVMAWEPSEPAAPVGPLAALNAARLADAGTPTWRHLNSADLLLSCGVFHWVLDLTCLANSLFVSIATVGAFALHLFSSTHEYTTEENSCPPA